MTTVFTNNMIFFKIFLFALFFTTSIMHPAHAAAATSGITATATASAQSDLQQLKSLLIPIESLSADFQQELLSKETAKPLHETQGKVWLKRPGLFRWEVNSKDPRVVVSNGKQVWDYDKDLEQVTIQKLSKGAGKAPIFFLTGDVNSLEKDFKIHQFTEKNKTCLSGSEQCFELHPKNDSSAFQVIRIGFKNKVLHELMMVDQLGQHSLIKFNNIKVNTAFAQSLFQLTIPKGVDVVGN